MTPKTTKHTCGGPVFGKLTVGCPRCDELKAGAAPIVWSKPRPWWDGYGSPEGYRQAAREAQRRADAEGHGVSTFGEW